LATGLKRRINRRLSRVAGRNSLPSPSRKRFTGSFTTGLPEVPQNIVVAIEDCEQIVEHFAKYPVTE
jgi:hypothetical protein